MAGVPRRLTDSITFPPNADWRRIGQYLAGLCVKGADRCGLESPDSDATALSRGPSHGSRFMVRAVAAPQLIGEAESHWVGTHPGQ
jgi:hypothetical protein